MFVSYSLWLLAVWPLLKIDLCLTYFQKYLQTDQECASNTKQIGSASHNQILRLSLWMFQSNDSSIWTQDSTKSEPHSGSHLFLWFTKSVLKGTVAISKESKCILYKQNSLKRKKKTTVRRNFGQGRTCWEHRSQKFLISLGSCSLWKSMETLDSLASKLYL